MSEDGFRGRRPLAVMTVFALALTGSPGAASAGDGLRVHSRPAASPGAGYWTAERMEEARPLAMVRSGDGSELRAQRNHPVPFTSGLVPDPTAFPSSVNGKLFGEVRGFGAFECSATVVDSANRRVIFTAGHCVKDPETGSWARRLAFVPAYEEGLKPFGAWSWSEAIITRPWARRFNSNFDYAAIVLAGSGTRVEDAVGALPLSARGPRDRNYTAVGYPGNVADGQRMWSCHSPYAGSDPHPERGGAPPMAIGCDMGGGASGGGWMTDDGFLASVTSFGYDGHPGVLYGPYFGRKAARVLANAGS